MLNIRYTWLFHFTGTKGMICIYFSEENRLNLSHPLLCEFFEKIINNLNWKILEKI